MRTFVATQKGEWIYPAEISKHFHLSMMETYGKLEELVTEGMLEQYLQICFPGTAFVVGNYRTALEIPKKVTCEYGTLDKKK